MYQNKQLQNDVSYFDIFCQSSWITYEDEDIKKRKEIRKILKRSKIILNSKYGRKTSLIMDTVYLTHKKSSVVFSVQKKNIHFMFAAFSHISKIDLRISVGKNSCLTETMSAPTDITFISYIPLFRGIAIFHLRFFLFPFILSFFFTKPKYFTISLN